MKLSSSVQDFHLLSRKKELTNYSLCSSILSPDPLRTNHTCQQNSSATPQTWYSSFARTHVQTHLKRPPALVLPPSGVRRPTSAGECHAFAGCCRHARGRTSTCTTRTSTRGIEAAQVHVPDLRFSARALQWALPFKGNCTAAVPSAGINVFPRRCGATWLRAAH